MRAIHPTPCNRMQCLTVRTSNACYPCNRMMYTSMQSMQSMQSNGAPRCSWDEMSMENTGDWVGDAVVVCDVLLLGSAAVGVAVGGDGVEDLICALAGLLDGLYTASIGPEVRLDEDGRRGNITFHMVAHRSQQAEMGCCLVMHAYHITRRDGLLQPYDMACVLLSAVAASMCPTISCCSQHVAAYHCPHSTPCSSGAVVLTCITSAAVSSRRLCHARRIGVGYHARASHAYPYTYPHT